MAVKLAAVMRDPEVTQYTVLVMWSRRRIATGRGQMFPEVPPTSKEVTFYDKQEAWDFIQAKLAGATAKGYECGITVACNHEVVYRTDNL